jgi:hypothetical protein
MLRRIIRWLTRADIRPTPEEKEPPPELARVRDNHRDAENRANRALRELHRLEQTGRGRH